MDKKEVLSSDLDLVKEFEQLKLKQKLLIDSLKKKKKTEQEQLFLDINAKLEFLVSIFKEAKEDEENENINKLETHVQELSEKFSTLEETIISKFEEFSKKIDSISEKQTVKEVAPPVPELPESKKEEKGKEQETQEEKPKEEKKKKGWF